MAAVEHVSAAAGVGRHEHDGDRVPLFTNLTERATAAGVELLRRFGTLWRVNGCVTGRYAGRPVRIPLLFGNGVQHLHVGERWFLELLRDELPKHPGAFVDVGANLGQTLLKVKLVDPARAYYGFEPNPQAYHYTRQLVDRNRFADTHLYPVGLSNVTAMLTLYSKADVDPSASVVPGFRSADRYDREEPVAVFRGDTLLADVSAPPVGAIKIDVEGAELEVVSGLQRTIAAFKPIIFCEVLPVFDPDSTAGALRLERQTALECLLRELGYRLVRVLRDGRREPVDSFGIHADMACCNYVFEPSSER